MGRGPEVVRLQPQDAGVEQLHLDLRQHQGRLHRHGLRPLGRRLGAVVRLGLGMHRHRLLQDRERGLDQPRQRLRRPQLRRRGRCGHQEPHGQPHAFGADDPVQDRGHIVLLADRELREQRLHGRPRELRRLVQRQRRLGSAVEPDEVARRGLDAVQHKAHALGIHGCDLLKVACDRSFDRPTPPPLRRRPRATPSRAGARKPTARAHPTHRAAPTPPTLRPRSTPSGTARPPRHR